MCKVHGMDEVLLISMEARHCVDIRFSSICLVTCGAEVSGDAFWFSTRRNYGTRAGGHVSLIQNEVT